MLAHQHVTEYNLVPSPEGIIIAETVLIYDAEDWIVRDRAKPYRDIKRGMLPPKLARILVNLGTLGKTGLTVYDPFCGTGTILAEALLSNCGVLGSDNNPAAISGSQANLAWLSQTYSITPSPNYSVALADVTHPPFPSADLIVTEPYMGPLVEGRNVPPVSKLKDLARGLDKLYRGAFRAWHPLLPAKGRVVITIPSFHSGNFDISTISVDTISALGYNFIASVPYGKPGSTVVRNITILEKLAN